VSYVLTGFIRRAELARDKSDQRPDRFAVGEKVDAKIVSVDRAARKLTLTIKGKEVEEEKQAMAEFGSSDSGAWLGARGRDEWPLGCLGAWRLMSTFYWIAGGSSVG